MAETTAEAKVELVERFQVTTITSVTLLELCLDEPQCTKFVLHCRTMRGNPALQTPECRCVRFGWARLICAQRDGGSYLDAS